MPVTRVAGRALAGCETAEDDGGQGVNLGQSHVVPDGAGPLGIPKQRADDPQPIRCLGVAAPRPPPTSSRVSVAAIFHAALDLGAERVVVLDGDVRSGEPWWVTWPLPESAQLYGIDVWLTGNAAREGHRITQVPLGRKVHNPGFPKIVKISQQVIDALWHLAYLSGAPRPAGVAQAAARSTVDDAAVRPGADLTGRTFGQAARYLSGRAGAVAEVYPCLAGAAPGPDGLVDMPAALWAEVLCDALAALAGGRAAEARDHLVALYLCRVAAYWREIERLRSPEAIDALLDEQSGLVRAAVTRRGLAACPALSQRGDVIVMSLLRD